MTQVTDPWSRPWHALQRTLAARITGSPAVIGSADYRIAVQPVRAPGATPPPRSWLREAYARREGSPFSPATPAGAK